MPAPGGQSHARREYASFRFGVDTERPCCLSGLRTEALADPGRAQALLFVADVHAAFLASGLSYRPNGRDLLNRDPGFLAGYLKKIQTKELDIPAKFVKGDSMKIMKYIMNLPEQNVGIMWRRAKRYNVVAEWQLRD